jgi:uncharacterized membrane protein HdeD (DUF308 family)
MAFRRVGKSVAVYSMMIGVAYVFTGLIEILGELGYEAPFMEVMLIPSSVFGGFMLLIIGVVFLFGIRLQSRGSREGLSYLAVGALLSAVFFAVYVCVLGANAIGHALGFEDWLEWTWLDDLRPGMWLFPLALPAIYMVLTKKEWRE